MENPSPILLENMSGYKEPGKRYGFYLDEDDARMFEALVTLRGKSRYALAKELVLRELEKQFKKGDGG